MSEHFEINRLVHLLRVDLTRGYRLILVASGAVAGGVAIVALLFQSAFANPQVAFSFLLAAALMIAAPIKASQSFLDLHGKTTNEAYLLLPASALEKMLARLIQTVVLLPIYMAIFAIVLSILVAILRSGLYGAPLEIFSAVPFMRSEFIGFVVVNQSIFFLGGAWFSRQQFFKTILVCTGLGIALTFFSMFVFRLFFADVWSGAIGANIDWTTLANAYSGPLRFLQFVMVILVYIALPVFCWAVSWMRIKETQVSHGV
jgi:hypothetical protein